MSEDVKTDNSNRRTMMTLGVVACAMLCLGFASKPLYDTFCKLTGYGGTTRQAEVNTSDILDRIVTVNFDSNVSGDLPWSFVPEVPNVAVNVGESRLAFYEVTNTADRAVTGTATFNVTPIKAAPYFIKTQCFCFTEQTLEAGQSVVFPVIFHIDAQIDDEKRLDDITDVTLSYTFFETDPTEAVSNTGTPAAQSREALN